MVWLLAVWTGMAAAQQLDLRVVPVTEGVILSIREVHVSSAAALHGTLPPSVGAPSGVEESLPVGAVVSRSFGPGAPSDKNWRFGAAGTPDMQERLAKTGYEVVVKMDDGEKRVFRVADASSFRPGQRVSVRAGVPEPAGI